MRTMESYLLGRTPTAARRDAAASVDAALRAGAADSSAATTVARLCVDTMPGMRIVG